MSIAALTTFFAFVLAAAMSIADPVPQATSSFTPENYPVGVRFIECEMIVHECSYRERTVEKWNSKGTLVKLGWRNTDWYDPSKVIVVEILSPTPLTK